VKIPVFPVISPIEGVIAKTKFDGDTVL